VAYFDKSGTPLSNQDAADQQFAGRPVFDANGNEVTVSLSNTPVDAEGDTVLGLDDSSAP
jgi:hypothetical protein